MSRPPSLKLVPKAPGLGDLQGVVRGYCTTRDAKKALLTHGLLEKQVYLAGYEAEDLAACLKSFRERPGYLVVAQDLSLFGAKRRAVADHTDGLERAGIRLIDIAHPQDLTYAAMIQRANVAISGARFHKDPKFARRSGSSGGTAKGLAAKQRRDEVLPEWFLDRLVDEPGVPWAIKEALVEPHISKATLRRHYGVKAALKRA